MTLGGVDPRLDNYFTEAEVEGGGYIGAVAGLDGAQTYGLFSHFQDAFFEASSPSRMIDYIDVEFFLAEAAQRGGYGVSGQLKSIITMPLQQVFYTGVVPRRK